MNYLKGERNRQHLQSARKLKLCQQGKPANSMQIGREEIEVLLGPYLLGSKSSQE